MGKIFEYNNINLPFSDHFPKNISEQQLVHNYRYSRARQTIENAIRLAFTCPKLPIETLEQGEKYVQS